ncbi:MAG: toxin TcdB middle/N-terminal domain-containing protein [Candidatus Methylacidiphilales bacterium]|nr:toxin TcdB middle/N-terminal domain-containing protein [Candidatus Methylacidiphilales bacterium]
MHIDNLCFNRSLFLRIFGFSHVFFTGFIAIGQIADPNPAGMAEDAPIEASVPNIVSESSSQETISSDATVSKNAPSTGKVKDVPVDETAALASTATAGSSSSDSSTENSGGGLSEGARMNFQTDLHTGRFSYGYPIQVAPARQGAEPKLSIAYNSSGGNGPCGVGWSLELGYIQRNGKKGVPVSWSGSNALSQYDDNRGFVISFGGVNAELVKVPDATAPGGFVYRAKTESAFLNCVYSAGYWLITDRSGNKFYFGQAANSRMDNPKPGWNTGNGTGTFRWALDKVEDVNGNITLITYSNDGGALYLQKIEYNGHVSGLGATHLVEFELEDRDDDSLDFRACYKVEQKKRYKEIRVKVGAGLVRKYVLGYATSNSTLRSRLISVTQYGADGTSALPATTFTYQDKPLEFESQAVEWTGVSGQGDNAEDKRSLRSFDGTKTRGDLVDWDGDGLPDRINRKAASPYDRYIVQYNKAGKNGPTQFTQEFLIQPLSGNQTSTTWRSLKGENNGSIVMNMLDLNGDGIPDRAYQENTGPYDRIYVQHGKGRQGTDSLESSPVAYTGIDAEDASSTWRALGKNNDKEVSMLDINGDGFPDRVIKPKNTPYNYFWAQTLEGTTFSPLRKWTNFQPYSTDNSWSSIFGRDNSGDTSSGFFDINGDGLPDRVARKDTSPYNQFQVQYNNGAGFEDPVWWGPLVSENTGNAWNAPVGREQLKVNTTLLDINGDGLPDRVSRRPNAPYTSFRVQLNTGTGFAAPFTWNNVMSELPTEQKWQSVSWMDTSYTAVDLLDMNGDGLLDRVVRKAAPPYDRFFVYYNKGPFPDLLSGITNGLGATTAVSYLPSTAYDNRDKPWTTDPWTEKAKGLLPFPVQTVQSVTVNDGMGNIGTTTYTYMGGMFDAVEREFRGFYQASMTDPSGMKTVKYFHQSGGRDGSTLGEFSDAGSKAKKGIPFLTETYGSDGNLYSRQLNKVEEVVLDSTTGWTFPYIAQTISLTYAGTSPTGGAYRATCQQFEYDGGNIATAKKGNLSKTTNLGEVGSVNLANHSFSDILPGGASDTVVNEMVFASLSNAYITDKPEYVRIKNASGTALRQTKFTYDGATGRVLTEQVWRDSDNTWLTSLQFSYDVYGNIETKTEANGVWTYLQYDPTYRTFPVTQQKGSFTSSTEYDARSGQITRATDIRGMVAESSYDTFFRLTETRISTTPGGPANLWRTRTSYLLGGIDGAGNSLNRIREQVYDPNDTANGHETYTYADGMGRSIQQRVEAENGQFRVTDTFYDEAGRNYYTTLPVFSAGSSFTAFNPSAPGTLTEFDAANRPFRTTPPDGETGSPTAPVVTQFSIGGDPWTVRTLDPMGKAHRALKDAYGRVRVIVEETAAGDLTTDYTYDPVGNLVQTTDHANNVTQITYNSLGQKTGMTEPNMGTWSYAYDTAGRLIWQEDAKGNAVYFHFTDPLGRISQKDVYNHLSVLTSTVTYSYDSGSSGYTVGPGQLHQITDSQGWEKFSYDARGRVIKSTRYLNVTSSAYTVETTYDEADRPQTVTYPANSATLAYTYDTAGHLVQIQSTAGTGGTEVFYSNPVWNVLGQLTSSQAGNGQTTTYEYYPNSKRLKRLVTRAGTNPALQDLTYTYDEASNIKSIADAVSPSGSASQSFSNATYDDLHRLTSLTSVGMAGTKSYTYDAIGNMVSSQEGAVPTTYTYGSSRPHAVTQAHGKTYAYDANGSMTIRGDQTLTYDPENRLASVTGGNATTTFGYAHDGSRLWKYNGTHYTIWIGGIYEIKDGKTLCHVLADGKRLCTFEPAGGMADAMGILPGIADLAHHVQQGIDWLLEMQRYPLTVTLLGLIGLLCLMLGANGMFTANRRRQGYGGQELAKHGGGRRTGVRSFARTILRATGGRFDSVCRSAGVPPAPAGILPAGASFLTPPLSSGTATLALPNPEFTLSWFSAVLRHPSTVVGPYVPTPWKTFFVQVVCFLTFLSVFFCSFPAHAVNPVFTPVFYYYHSDHLGSSSIMTDRSGEVVQKYTYTPFGRELSQDNTQAFEVSHRFTGQIFDEDTGLYYFNARYYDPELGRFISADTIVPDPQNPQTFNRYAYSLNNPLKYVDPSGHEPITITAIVVGILIATAVGAAAGAAVAAAQGGNIAMGALTGAISGFLGGLGALGGPAGAIAASAAAGAINAAITGGDIAQSALVGGITGGISFAASSLTQGLVKGIADPVIRGAIQTGASTATGAVTGGVGSVLMGGDFWQGAAVGAATGAAIGTVSATIEFIGNSTESSHGYMSAPRGQSRTESQISQGNGEIWYGIDQDGLREFSRTGEGKKMWQSLATDERITLVLNPRVESFQQALASHNRVYLSIHSTESGALQFANNNSLTLTQAIRGANVKASVLGINACSPLKHLNAFNGLRLPSTGYKWLSGPALGRNPANTDIFMGLVNVQREIAGK